MTKIFKQIIAIAVAFVMLVVSSVTCFAASNETNAVSSSAQSRIIFDGSGSKKLNITSDYQTIAHVDKSSSKGFGATIVILVTVNEDICTNDIRMLDKNGNQVWVQEGAISYQGTQSFDCGTNVYTVQIKTGSGTGWAYAGYVKDL